MSKSADEIVGGMIVFFLVFIIGGIIFSYIFKDSQVGFILSLFAGIIMGGGTFLFLSKKD